MKSITKIPLIAILLVFIVSCQKREEKTFTVKIYNPVTDEPYEDIYVAIAERTNTTDGYVTEEFLFFEGYTDASGELTITGEFHKRYAYQLLTGSPEDVPMCHIREKHQGRESGPGLQLDNKNLHGSTAYVELVPCANIKLEINNVNCTGANDSISVFRELLSLEDYETWSATNPYTQVGCQQTISPSFFTVLMGEYHFWWNVTKNNVTNTYHDTVYFSADEHKIYEINY